MEIELTLKKAANHSGGKLGETKLKKFFINFFAILFFLFPHFIFSQNSSNAGTNQKSAGIPEKQVSELNPDTEYLAKSGTSVNAVAWSNNGEYFAASWNNTTILFESETNNIAAIYSNSADNKINPFTDITKITFAPDDSTLLSIHNNNTAMVHSIGNSDSALITGTGKKLADAVYIGSSFRLIIPVDEKNLYECTRRSGSKNFTLEKKMNFNKKIVSLASNGADGKILVAFEDGSVNLIDTRNWQILGDLKTYLGSNIHPQFARDSAHFLSATDKNHIFVSNIKNPEEKNTIQESDGFVNSALFSPDGKNIIAATNSGYVRIYEIATGYVLYEFRLSDLDTAKTLAASPDGEFVLIGTAKGFIYRWSLNGYKFDEDKKGYYDDEGEKYSSKETESKSNLTKPRNSLNIMFDYSTIEKYYYGSFGANLSYRNYCFYPLYVGGGLRAGAGVPKKDFPWEYTYEGEKLRNPFAYSFIGVLNGGISYYNERFDILLFSEVGIGGAVRFLHNTEIKNSYRGKIYPCGVAEASFGIQYQWLRAEAGIMYDTNLGVIFRAGIGYSLRFRTKQERQERAQAKIQAKNQKINQANQENQINQDKSKEADL